MDHILNNPTLTLLVYLLTAVGLDLLLRWIAFERVESIAIDIAIFSAVYSGIEMLKAETGSPLWKVPTILGLLCIGLLAAVHRFLLAELKEMIEETYMTLQNRMSDSKNKDVISVNIPVAKYAIPLSLSTSFSWIRIGKKRRRENIIKALRKADLDPTNYLNEETSFLLPVKLRRFMCCVFFLGGTIAVIIPVIYTIFFVNNYSIF